MLGTIRTEASKPVNDIFPNGDVVLRYAISHGCTACHSSIMYRKRARLTEACSFPVMIDLSYTAEFLMHGRGKVLEKEVGCYRVNARDSILTDDDFLIEKFKSVYSKYYYKKLGGKYKDSFFLYNFTGFLINLKKFRLKASLYFLRNLISMFSVKGLIALPGHIVKLYRMRKLCL